MRITPDKIVPSLYGGLLVATLWAVPGLNLINCLCCAGVILGGMLSVTLYQKEFRDGHDQMVLQDCVNVGLITAVIGSIAAVTIQLVVDLFFGNVAIEVMMHIVSKMQVEFPQEFLDMIEEAKTAKPNMLGSLLAIFVYIVPNSIFSVLGALIGWNIFKPNKDNTSSTYPQ